MSALLNTGQQLQRTPPKGTYNGITLILDQPSRIDLQNGRLLTGTAGQWFHSEVCLPEFNLFNCDIRTAACPAPLLPNTKAVALLGEAAMRLVDSTHKLTDLRGSPLRYCGLPAIASFAPQDSRDLRNYEHPELEESDADEDEQKKKDRSKTSRANYQFWLWADIQKLKRYAKLYKDPALNARPFGDDTRPVILRPPTGLAVDSLRRCHSVLFVDIECHPCGLINVLGFACDDGPVFSIPLYDYTGARHTDALKIMAAFSQATFRVRTVAHNGAAFDFPYLIHYGNVPLGKSLWDTLVTQHRIYPEAEKSLAHCISLWTDAPFHKDEAIYDPHTFAAETQFLNYNAKDVARMRDIYHAQLRFAEGDVGLQASIAQANASIYPLVLAGGYGIRVDKEKFDKARNYATEQAAWIRKIIAILVGYELNPGSSQQKAEYLCGRLGYKPIAYTEAGAPSTGRAELIKMRIAHSDNPVLTALLAYAAVNKQGTTLENTILWDDTIKQALNDEYCKAANAGTKV